MTTKSVIINALALCLVVFALSACSSEVLTEGFPVLGDEMQIALMVQDVPLRSENTRGQVTENSSLNSIGLFGLKHSTLSFDNSLQGDFIYHSEVLKENTWKTDYAWPGANFYLSLFAYAPYQANGTSTTLASEYGAPKLHYEVPNQAENHADLVAAQNVQMSGDACIKVPMEMEHICARVKLKIYQGRVKTVKFINVNNRGSYNFKTKKWENVSRTAKACEIVHEFIYPTGADDESLYDLTFFMIPQDIPSEATFEITYEDGSVSTEQKLISDNPLKPSPLLWEAGETYEYVLASANADFSYTGAPQIYYVPDDGSYQIECWGAQGGGGVGGKGGYTRGVIHLMEGQLLYIYVGNQPARTENAFNGGGLANNSWYPTDDGGGASDVRYYVSEDMAWNDLTSLMSRIMVAGAGGGAHYYQVSGTGGYGGGLTGGDGTFHGSGDGNSCYPTGGTQISGGIRDRSQYPGEDGGFGYGGNGELDWGGGGGGSGWYGGGGGSNAHHVSSGGGGSSYISGHTGCVSIKGTLDSNGNIQAADTPNHFSGMVFSDTQMIDGAHSMTEPDGTTSTGHSGNGYVRITQVSKD